MNSVKDTAIDSGAGVAGAVVGGTIAGPLGAIAGAIVTPVLGDVLQRVLSKKEKTRIEKVAHLAIQQIEEKIAKGTRPTRNAKEKKIKELFEGTLLTAKNTYEEKKLPFIAQLFATSPFTNTPLENIVQSLILAEQLSYRQLCLITIIGQNQWGNNPLKLSAVPPIKRKGFLLDENISGVYEDLNYLCVIGVMGLVLSKDAGPAISSGTQFMAPSNLILLYPGTLLDNGMQLGNIDKTDKDQLLEMLRV